MAPIAGNYQLLNNENFVEYMAALGIPEDKAKLIDSLKPKLEVVVSEQKITLISDSGNKKITHAFVVGEEVDEQMPNNIVLKSRTELDGDTVIVSSKTPKGKTGSRIYKFTDSELVMTMNLDGHSLVAKRFYKRI